MIDAGLWTSQDIIYSRLISQRLFIKITPNTYMVQYLNAPETAAQNQVQSKTSIQASCCALELRYTGNQIEL